jgi:O-succinylbenzoic acid--CoA ligase
MKAITLNQKIYPLEWLLDPATEIDRQALTPYEKGVLRFCRQWLSGQETFTVTTSGSTGQPKPIVLSRKQMKASARMTGQALGLQPGDKALVCLSTQYIAGMMMLVRGFELDLDLTVVNPSSNPLHDFSPDTRFDFSAFVPLQLQQILTESLLKQTVLNRMKAIMIGGAPISLALKKQLQVISAPIFHTYGMTETVTHIALKRLNGPQASDYFSPLPGVEVSLDSRGCLTIIAAVTNGQTIYTNDLAELRPDGSFKWLGRVDNVINSGGVKVQVEKVETTLEDVLRTFHDGRLAKRRFMVGPMPHTQLGQVVVVIIEGNPFSPDEQVELQTKLQKILTKYEIPRTFHFIPVLPETPTGKIDRVACLKEIDPTSGDKIRPKTRLDKKID